jgi:hypothetical protein
MAGKGRRAAAFGFIGGLVLAGAGWGPAQARSGPIFTVGRVSVSATAADAVKAKDKAIAQGQEKALRLLLKRLTPFSAHNRLPLMEAGQAERMIDGMSVRSERNSSTQYLATLDFTFQSRAVTRMLNRLGLPYASERSPQISVLPVLVEKGVLKPAGRNPWQKSFDSLDLDHMLTPMKVVPPRPDFIAPTFNGASAGAPSLMETLKFQYRAKHMVLAYADIDRNAGALNVRLMGTDPAGEISLTRRYKIYDQDLAEVTRRAARISAQMIQDRWKLTRLAAQGALDGPSELERMDVTAEFTGAREWRKMHAALRQAPGMRGLEVKSLYARGASISLQYPGGPQRLAKVLQRYGIVLESRGGGWTLSAGAR